MRIFDNNNGGSNTKTGKVVRKFNIEDGRSVILRTPKWDDLDGLMELINSLIEEKAEICITSKFTREEEAKWLHKTLLQLEKNEGFFLVAEVDGSVVASSNISILCGDEKHVGVVGIVVKSGFRDSNIGSEIMKTLVEQAALLKLKALMLQVFATNKRAIHVYEKIGFSQSGRIPKKHFRLGKHIDEIIMTRQIN